MLKFGIKYPVLLIDRVYKPVEALPHMPGGSYAVREIQRSVRVRDPDDRH